MKMEKTEVELAKRQYDILKPSNIIIINNNNNNNNNNKNNNNNSDGDNNNESNSDSDSNSDDDDDDDDINSNNDEKSLIRKRINNNNNNNNNNNDIILGDYIIDDLKTSIYNARYALPIIILISIIIGYLIVIAPYHVQLTLNSFHNNDDLSLIRPLLSDKEQKVIRRNLMLAETQFWMPLPSYNIITMKFHQQVSKHGTFNPPQLFYDGVVFGLSSDNSHDLNFTSQNKNSVVYKSIKEDLVNMNPKPTNVFQKSSSFLQTGYQEEGWAVYFKYEDLEKQGRLSSDKLRPWKRILDDILNIARDYRQVSITAWYPNVFGVDPGPEYSEEDRNRYKNIIQEVIPTRTGLDILRSTVTVWMSHVNATAVKKKKHVYRRLWTPEDENYHMLTDQQKEIVLESTYSNLRRGLRSVEIEVDGD